MKKPWVWLGWFLIALAGLSTGAGFWFVHRYPPDRLRQMAINAASNRLGRRIDVGGAHVSLLKGLELRDIRISESPDFSTGTFFSADSAFVLPRLLPLLLGNLVVGKVELVHPRVRLHRLLSDTFNFSSLANASSGSAPNQSGYLFFISDAVVHRGEVVYQDDILNTEIRLSGLESRVAGLSFTDPFGATIDANVEVRYADTRWKGPLSVQARLSLSGDKAVVVKKFSLGLGSSSLQAAGTFRPAPMPRVDATLTMNSLSAEDLAPFVNLPDPFHSAALSGRWSIQGTTSAFRVDGEFIEKSPTMDFSGDLKVSRENGRYAIQLKPVSVRLENNPSMTPLTVRGPLEGLWTGDYNRGAWTVKGSLAAEQTGISYGGWLSKPAGSPLTLGLSASSIQGEAPQLNIDLRAPDLIVAPEGPWPTEIHLSGKVGVTAEIQGTPSLLNFSLTADGQSMDTRVGSTLQKPSDSALFLSTEGQLAIGASQENRIRVELSTSSTLHTAAGDLKIGGTITYPHLVDVTVDGTLPDLSKLQTLLPALTEYHLRGQSTLSAQVTGPVKKSIVRGHLTVSNGSVRPIPGVTLSELKGQMEWTREKAEIKTIEGKAFGSPFRLAGKLTRFDRPTLVLDGDWDKMEIEKVLKVFSSSSPAGPASTSSPTTGAAPLARAEGTFRIGEIVHPHYRGREFQFNWNLSDVGPNLAVLSGTATVTAADGEIINVPVAKKINRLMDRDGMDIRYQTLVGKFVVDRGLARIPTFTLNSDQTDFSAQGQVRLGNMESDLNLILKLPAGSVRGNVGEWMTADDGRPTIKAHLKGPLRDPKVKVNYSETVKRAAQQILKKTFGGWKGKTDPPENGPSAH